MRTLTGHSGSVVSATMSLNKQWILTSSRDCTTRLWETATGKELCSLVSFTDGTWAVVDPDGRFDASNSGDVQGLHWVVGNEPIDLAQLKERYYDPGLLAKKMGFNKEPLRQVDAFTNPKLFPTVQLSEPTAENPKVGITLTNRGGGIGRVIVKINGKELTADARNTGHDPNVPTMRLDVDLANDPRLKPGEPNKIEVQAFNAEGYLRSRGVELVYTPSGKASAEPMNVWAVVAGVSKYRGDGIRHLRYAAKDAEDFGAALNIAATRLFTPTGGKVHITLLTTTQSDVSQQPTRANVERAFRAAQQSKPGDILVVYLAGHGVNHGGQDGDFYFLSSEAQSANLDDPEIRRQVALSSHALTDLIKQIPAQKQVLFLDTCASGKAVEKLTEKRDVPASQIRALERVKDRTGLHILAGCAADAVSYEATRYGQGILTYTLLMGMRGAKLRQGQYVDVADLFGFTADKVPELAKDIGGIQRSVIASPKGASFDVGQVTTEDQPRIPLQPVRPLVLQSNFQEEKRFADVLKLGARIDELLRDASARGRQPPLVFVDAKEMPGAFSLAGRYRIENGRAIVDVNLLQGNDVKESFTVTGSEADVPALIAREAEQRLATKEKPP